jgi:hypothetical protein
VKTGIVVAGVVIIIALGVVALALTLGHAW